MPILPDSRSVDGSPGSWPRPDFLSPRRFIQAFTRTFGEPPHRHIVGLRLSFAEKLLIQGELTIAEVAYLSGFSSQNHLTTAMRTGRQTTPRAIRGGR